MAPVHPGAPHESPKPQPIGNIPMIFLFTTCTLCILFILWRRAHALRSVVSHQLKTLTGSEGRIRLSEDSGPPAREFLEDDDDEDHEGLDFSNANGEMSIGHVHETVRPAPEQTPAMDLGESHPA